MTRIKMVIILMLSMLVLAPITSLLLSGKPNYLAHGDIILEYANINTIESKSEYGVGLWYSPYVKIYSIGGDRRIAEISNYPRAYKDTDPHLDKDGNPLPGAFPLWIESESLPFVPNRDIFKFPIDEVPGSITLIEVGLKVSDKYFEVGKSSLNTIKTELGSGVIEFDRVGGQLDRQIIRIEYRRGT